MTGKQNLALDIIERAAATWLEGFLGLLIVAQVWNSTQAGALIGILQVVQVAAVSAVPAALAVIKGGISSFIGNRNTASALPKPLEPAPPAA